MYINYYNIILPQETNFTTYLKKKDGFYEKITAIVLSETNLVINDMLAMKSIANKNKIVVDL